MIIDENFHDLQEKVGVRVRTIHTLLWNINVCRLWLTASHIPCPMISCVIETAVFMRLIGQLIKDTLSMDDYYKWAISFNDRDNNIECNNVQIIHMILIMYIYSLLYCVFQHSTYFAFMETGVCVGGVELSIEHLLHF